MTQFLKNSLVTIALLSLIFGSSCVNSDGQFGNGILPPEYGMKTYVDSSIMPQTYLYAVDSLPTISIYRNTTLTTAVFPVGSRIDPLVGRTSSQVYTNFNANPNWVAKGKYFGLSPEMDSLMLNISLMGYVGDTTMGTEFEVYEIPSNPFSWYKTYYTNLDMTPYMTVPTPLLKFNIKAPKDVSLKLPKSYAERFFINTQNDSNPYHSDTVFHKHMGGLYIKTKDVMVGQEGCIYYINLAGSNMQMHYRDAHPSKLDTLRLDYLMYTMDQYGRTQSPVNTAFSTVQHDLSLADPSQGGVDVSQIGDKSLDTEYGYIGTIGGVGTAIVITKDQIDQIKDKAKGLGYGKIAVHSAELVFEMGDKTYENYDRAHMNIAPYRHISTFEYIQDYYMVGMYVSQTMGTIGGALNRSVGKYTMNISSFVQGLFLGRETGDKYTLEIAPMLHQHTLARRTALMGSGSINPPRLIITYTMLK